MIQFYWHFVPACLSVTDGVNVWHLWVVSQVDLPGDVVDGADPLRKKEKPHSHLR